MEGNATLRRGRRGTHSRNTYVVSLTGTVHIGGLASMQVGGSGLLLPSAAEAVTYMSALRECPDRARCVLNRAGAKPARHHEQFMGFER